MSSGGGLTNYGALSYFSSISADGRFVAFQSDATSLVVGDTNGAPDIFVHDRQTGTTTRVSVDSAGGQANSGSSYPSISADGRFVAFVSWASNLVAGDTNGREDIFVHDRQSGTTTRVSVDSAGEQGNGYSNFAPTLSADGRFVAFASDASNLVAGDTNGTGDIFVHQCAAELSVLITNKSGLRNARLWTLTLNNKGDFPADTAQIDGLTLTQTYGTACTPVITSPVAFPLAVGTVPAGSIASGTVTLDFTGCANTARFRATIPFSADNGAVSGTKTLNNQFR